MRRYLLATAAVLALSAPAAANVILDTQGLGGTGTNVTFNSFNPLLGLVLGTLNGQNNDIVRFRDLSGNANFSGSAGSNGNDIKLFNTSDLDITVFDVTNLIQLGTTRDIFSIKGSGSAFFNITTQEPDGTFQTTPFGLPGGYSLSLSGQSGFDFKAINGEIISDIDVYVVGGLITDFEHFRIDAVPLAEVPGPVVGAGFPGIVAGCIGLWGLAMKRRRRNQAHA
jgi:hypothetical protein